jgi:formylglycine-generating enzyme required for sulfatase activity
MKMSMVFLVLIVFLFSQRVIAEPEMVFVKGGCFEMGDISGVGNDREKPVHEVCVDDFYLGKYEVTQREWVEVMKTNPSNHKLCDDCPVEQVSWLDIRKFITKLKEKTGKKYRLPTEAEWEYAARSGGKKEIWSGTSDEVELEDYAWYKDNSLEGTHPVGQKEPNGLGIYDMSGNVWEWVWDRYDEEYYESSPKDNPKGSLSGNNRIVRGGSWYWDALSLRTTYRYDIESSDSFKGLGFRIALSAQ